MKALFVYLPAFLFLFLLGCQENSITDPGTIDDNTFTAQDDQNFASKDFISAYPRLIEISELIMDPTHPMNIDGDQIKGIIRYDHQVTPVYSTPEVRRYRIDLKFYVNLRLNANCPNHPDCMKILGTSTDMVYFPGRTDSRNIQVEKVFSVRNCCCGQMNLILKFNVDNKDIVLASMSLKKISSRMPIGDPSL
jgi:hypothetical protein